MPDAMIYLCVVVLCGAGIALVAVVSCAMARGLQWVADKVMERWWRQ